MSAVHYGRKRAVCRATGPLTKCRRDVTCPDCIVEMSGRELLAAFRRDMDGAL
jgi:hypothetical protein